MTPRPGNDRVRAWYGLMLAHERVMGRLRTEFRSLGLTVSEFDVLVNLAPGVACRHTDLADRVVLSRTALTRLVDRLQGRGLVERRGDGHDGRVVWIGLTPAGVSLRRTALHANTSVVESCLAGLDAGELAVLRPLLGRIGSTAQPDA